MRAVVCVDRQGGNGGGAAAVGITVAFGAKRKPHASSRWYTPYSAPRRARAAGDGDAAAGDAGVGGHDERLVAEVLQGVGRQAHHGGRAMPDSQRQADDALEEPTATVEPVALPSSSESSCAAKASSAVDEAAR